MPKPEVVAGQPPSASEEMWLDLGRSLAKGSIDAIEGTAKNLLTGVGVLEGLYFHAVSFEKVYDRIKPMAHYLGVDPWAVALLFGLPVLLWLISAVAATLALMVRRTELQLDMPSTLQAQIQAIAAYKYAWVRRGLILLLAGLALLAVNLFLYLAS